MSAALDLRAAIARRLPPPCVHKVPWIHPLVLQGWTQLTDGLWFRRARPMP